MFRRIALTALAGLLAACASTPTTTVSPTTESSNAVASTDPARAIVSLSPSGTETLFAIGAGEQVVAVDEYSYYPPEAPVTDLSGYTPNVEAIVSYDPDLVLVSDDLNGVVAALEALDVKVLHLPAVSSLPEVYDQIRTLGRVTHRDQSADELVASMEARVETAVGSISNLDPRPTFFHEIDATLYTADSTTFIGSVYAMLGLDNIADGVDPGGNGYPQLTVEYLLEIDPDFIFLADAQYGETAAIAAARSGWGGLQAIQGGTVVELPPDIHSRWGPRIVEFIEFVASTVLAAGVVAGATG